ncbi:hypothetical protein Tco_0110315 [Tanacetum coccineum]
MPFSPVVPQKKVGDEACPKELVLTEWELVQEAEVPQDETEHEESVPTPSNEPQPSGEDSMQLTDLMVLCTKLQTQVLDLEKAKDAQAKKIAALKKRIQKLERKKMLRPTGLKRLKKVGMSRRVESSEDQESLVAPEDASKQGRSIADIDADVEVTLVDETQERQDYELMFDTGVLDTDEMKQKLMRKMNRVPSLMIVLLVKQLLLLVENTQAMIEDDRLLAERLQSKEREKLTDEEKGKLFMKLMEKIRKHFAALRAQEKRNIPILTSKRETHNSGINTFVAMGSEVQESKEKKVEGSEETAKGSRKKMLGRKREVNEDDEAELKKLLVIKKDEDITINAIRIATTLPVTY